MSLDKNTDGREETEMPAVAENWYEHAFEDLYPVLYANRSIEAAKPEVQFAVDALRLTEDHEILDLCCGTGRHMFHLLKYVRRVTGLDYSDTLLREARKTLGGQARLVRADMRFVPMAEAFDAVCNFFTSFGYFAQEEDNLAAIQHFADALRPSGSFFIDFINRDYICQYLVPHSERSAGEYDVQDERWIDVKAERLNKRTTVIQEGRVIEVFTESVRLYTPQHFVEMLERAGLRPERIYGDYSGAPLDPDLPRMIFTGSKA